MFTARLAGFHGRSIGEMTPKTAPVMLAALCLVLACKRAPPPPPARADFDAVADQRRLHCQTRSSIDPGEHNETCRVLADFAAGRPFDGWPTSGTDLWFGREFQAQPDEDVGPPAMFILVRLVAQPIGDDVVKTWQLDRAALVPCSLLDLPMTRFADATGTTDDARARAEGKDVRALVAALSAGAAPDPRVVGWVGALRGDWIGLPSLRGPAALVHTSGPSVEIVHVSGGFMRFAGDGRRMLIAEQGRAAELWLAATGIAN
jgi:hypothetical protein